MAGRGKITEGNPTNAMNRLKCNDQTQMLPISVGRPPDGRREGPRSLATP